MTDKRHRTAVLRVVRNSAASSTVLFALGEWVSLAFDTVIYFDSETSMAIGDTLKAEACMNAVGCCKIYRYRYLFCYENHAIYS